MFHPRNLHQGKYNFDKLKLVHPALKPWVAKNKYGDDSIDFANSKAVIELNRALLSLYYGIQRWEIPAQYLCPPIPGRADYIHYLADLLASSNGGVIPRGELVKGLDIGVGANCIYPIIGYSEYSWKFLGTDINPIPIAAAQANIDANPSLQNHIQLILHSNKLNIFKGVIPTNEVFDFSMCNPPFHDSIQSAQQGSVRKWKNLGKSDNFLNEKPVTNFGGQGEELWCEGGELTFILKMIKESSEIPHQVKWFSTLVSKEQNLSKIYARLKLARAKNWHTIDMSQGQKKSRIVAWTFRVV